MHNSAKFPLAHVVQEKNAGSGQKMSVCAYLVLFPRSAREKNVNGLKKCLCICSSALVFTQCKRKKHVNGLKKCLFVCINFYVVEPSTPLMLWKIQTESNYPV